jgi:protein involved in polysaccharide export with SLBB domain
VSFIDGTRAAPRGFVYITGEVKNPGKYPLVGSMTVLKLLALAGDVLPSADKNRIVIVSGTATDQDGKPLTRFINYNDLMNGKNLSENNLDLGPGDAVIVHPPGR